MSSVRLLKEIYRVQVLWYDILTEHDFCTDPPQGKMCRTKSREEEKIQYIQYVHFTFSVIFPRALDSPCLVAAPPIRNSLQFLERRNGAFELPIV